MVVTNRPSRCNDFVHVVWQRHWSGGVLHRQPRELPCDARLFLLRRRSSCSSGSSSSGSDGQPTDQAKQVLAERLRKVRAIVHQRLVEFAWLFDVFLGQMNDELGQGLVAKTQMILQLSAHLRDQSQFRQMLRLSLTLSLSLNLSVSSVWLSN
jgi:hypothetical protein